eukprot:scaffold201322_cov21-Prasinocladus_malaysianus.AAC.1
MSLMPESNNHQANKQAPNDDQQRAINLVGSSLNQCTECMQLPLDASHSRIFQFSLLAPRASHISVKANAAYQQVMELKTDMTCSWDG